MKRLRVRLDDGATERMSGPAGVGMSREEWQARVDRVEGAVLAELFDAFEVARSFLGLRIVDVAARAQMSDRMLEYHRARKSGLTFRQAIVLAEGHDMEFTVHVRMKRKRRAEVEGAVAVKNPARMDSGTTALTEESTDVR